MRISTSQIFDAGALGIQNGQGSLFKLQNQLSTGRKVLTPKDDPVAAAQALVVTQSRDVNSQFMVNQGQAKSQLGLVDSQLTAVIENLQNVREKVVQAGNTILSQQNREAIAQELESRLNELIGIANSDNGSGEFLFSGYRGNVLPFAASGAVVPPATTRPITYYGDDGERLLQVSSSRQMAVSVPGSDVFMEVKQGNGTFVAATSGNLGGGINHGTATVDAGSVTDQQRWVAAVNGFGWSTPTNPAIQVRFSVDALNVTRYQLYDVSGAVPAAMTNPAIFTPGQAISIASANPPALTTTDFGSHIVVQGQPADGDTFSIRPSTNQSLFQTMQNLLGILRNPVGSVTNTSTQYSNDLGGQLTNLDQAFDNITRVQATIGTRLQEIDSLGNAASDLDIQYQSTLSDLQDLDYTKAISDFIKQQTNLEAAQKSFAQISGMSLFNYL